MTELFEKTETNSYEYAPIETITPGDRCAITFEENKSFLPSQGGSLSGEAVEYLSGGEYGGLVLETDEIHWTPTDGVTDTAVVDFPERLSSIQQFLLEHNATGLAEALAELMDLTLIYDFEALHGSLDSLFGKLQTALRTEKNLKQSLRDNSAAPRELVESDINRIKRGRAPDFKQTIADFFEPLCQFHHQLRGLHDELVECYIDQEASLRSLLEEFPADKLNAVNSDSTGYYESVLGELLEQRSNHSPLSNFEPERAHTALVTPAFDESDFEMLKTIALVKQILENFLFRGIFLTRRFDELTRLIEDSIIHDNKMYRRLTFPREESDFLLSHIVNVFLLSTFVAEHLNVDPALKRDLTVATVLFDTGMLRVAPRAWMHSEEPSNEEIKMIKRHPLFTTEWLKESHHSFSEATRDIIRRHHERLDGSGYPQNVDADDLSLPQSILIVTDVYDAMSTTRPHRPAISPDKIITYLKNRANKFEQSVISVLENYIGPYPPGTVVQLNSNEIGVAMAGGKDPSNPKVKIVIDSQGDVYDNPQITDLSTNEDKRIVETVGTRNTPSALLKFIGD